MKQRSGFTLLELLVAAVIMIVILAALGGLFATTVRANRTNTLTSEGQQNAEAAIQLLKTELGLAGYRGTDSAANSRTFSSSTLVVTPETSTLDRVTVRFFEDRYVACPSGQTYCPTERMLTFGVNTSTKELTRQQDGGLNRAVVEGVTGLKVMDYLPGRGLTVRLTFADETTKNVAIALNNPQQ